MKMSENNNMYVVQCVSSSKNEWLSVHLEELIDLWEEQRPLYDVSHCDYKNRRKRNRILEEISAHLNRPGHEVKTKMKNLRSQFLAELRKQRESAKKSVEAADLYTSKWKYFGRLAFILTNYPMAQLGNTSASDFSHDLSDAEDETMFEVTDDSSGPVVKQEVTRSKSKRIKRQKKEPDPVFNAEEVFERSIHSADIPLPIRVHEREQERERDDGYEIFGRHIANELRNLSVRHCQLAKLKIQQVLYDLQTTENMGENRLFSQTSVDASLLSGMSQPLYKGSKSDTDKDPLV